MIYDKFTRKTGRRNFTGQNIKIKLFYGLFLIENVFLILIILSGGLQKVGATINVYETASSGIRSILSRY